MGLSEIKDLGIIHSCVSRNCWGSRRPTSIWRYKSAMSSSIGSVSFFRIDLLQPSGPGAVTRPFPNLVLRREAVRGGSAAACCRASSRSWARATCSTWVGAGTSSNLRCPFQVLSHTLARARARTSAESSRWGLAVVASPFQRLKRGPMLRARPGIAGFGKFSEPWQHQGPVPEYGAGVHPRAFCPS